MLYVTSNQNTKKRPDASTQSVITSGRLVDAVPPEFLVRQPSAHINFKLHRATGFIAFL